jgi:hypothetical protein
MKQKKEKSNMTRRDFIKKAGKSAVTDRSWFYGWLCPCQTRRAAEKDYILIGRQIQLLDPCWFW